MRQAILILVALVVLGASAGALVVFLGLYNVSARAGHWPGVSWVLHTTFRNSVKLNAGKPASVPADLGPDRISLGAGHFDSACRFCHARPDEERSITVRRMQPAPPHVMDIGGKWAPEELHWIVSEGAKMTGMPPWPADRDDEVWALVAFLEAAPSMTGAEYQALLDRDAAADRTAPGGESQPSAVEPAQMPLPPKDGADAGPRPSDRASLSYLAQQQATTQALPADAGPPEGVAYCATCHARDGRSGNPHIPRLDIQSKDYLLEALRAYADDIRASGFMTHAVSVVPPDALEGLAEYFANLPPKPDPLSKGAAGADPDLIKRGRELALGQTGDRKVPACAACHGPVAQDAGDQIQLRPEFPALGGQYRDYLEGQMHLWRKTFRGGGQAAKLMWQASRNLSDDDITALAAYYAGLAPEKLPQADRIGGAPR